MMLPAQSLYVEIDVCIGHGRTAVDCGVHMDPYTPSTDTPTSSSTTGRVGALVQQRLCTGEHLQHTVVPDVRKI